MKELKSFSDAELAKELRRREDEKKKSRQPVAKLVIDWSILTRMVEQQVSAINDAPEDERGVDEDFDHYVFEAVMEAIYGPDIWTWWNEMVG